jgi:hypothetical protein
MIKKILLTVGLALMILSCESVKAQFIYNLTVLQQPYQPLTSGTSLNGANIWDDANYKRTTGFNFEFNWKAATAFGLVLNPKGMLISTDTTSLFTGFLVTDIDLIDKAKMNGSSTTISSIKYSVTGSGGSRILKIEIANAGFWREKYVYGTSNDSISLQAWIYEGTNVVELRYGPRQITYPADYFVYGGPVIGFVKDAGLFSMNLNALYYLKNDPQNPDWDSATTNITQVTSGLNSFPSEGTVYRFTPQPNAITTVGRVCKVEIYPTVSHKEIIIKNNENEIISYHITTATGVATELKGELQTGMNRLTISGLPQGVYLITVFGSNTKAVSRLVKI